MSSVDVSLGGLSSLALLSLLSCYSPTRPFVRRTAVDPISFRLRRSSHMDDVASRRRAHTALRHAGSVFASNANGLFPGRPRCYCCCFPSPPSPPSPSPTCRCSRARSAVCARKRARATAARRRPAATPRRRERRLRAPSRAARGRSARRRRRHVARSLHSRPPEPRRSSPCSDDAAGRRHCVANNDCREWRSVLVRGSCLPFVP